MCILIADANCLSLRGFSLLGACAVNRGRLYFMFFGNKISTRYLKLFVVSIVHLMSLCLDWINSQFNNTHNVYGYNYSTLNTIYSIKFLWSFFCSIICTLQHLLKWYKCFFTFSNHENCWLNEEFRLSSIKTL